MFFDVLQSQLKFVRKDFFEIGFFGIVALGEHGSFVYVVEGSVVGKPRANAEDFSLLRAVVLHITGYFGPGPDDAHVAAKDVPQLRELIQFVAAQETPHGRNALVGTHGEQALLVRPGVHAAEFEQLKGLAMTTNAGLAIKDTTPRTQPDAQRQEQEERREDDECRTRCENVKDALCHAAKIKSLPAVRTAFLLKGLVAVLNFDVNPRRPLPSRLSMTGVPVRMGGPWAKLMPVRNSEISRQSVLFILSCVL